MFDRVEMDVGDSVGRLGKRGQLEIMRREQRVTAIDRRQVPRAGIATS
jgi:hypothetical protein